MEVSAEVGEAACASSELDALESGSEQPHSKSAKSRMTTGIRHWSAILRIVSEAPGNVIGSFPEETAKRDVSSSGDRLVLLSEDSRSVMMADRTAGKSICTPTFPERQATRDAESEKRLLGNGPESLRQPNQGLGNWHHRYHEHCATSGSRTICIILPATRTLCEIPLVICDIDPNLSG